MYNDPTDPNNLDELPVVPHQQCVGCMLLHYANMSVQYTAIFHGYKNDYFQMKFFNIFFISAQNIDCGYTLEPPH